MPTLDMTLFDWTDYEDMKPVDTWPSSRKKGQRLTFFLGTPKVFDVRHLCKVQLSENMRPSRDQNSPTQL